jgi:transketolase
LGYGLAVTDIASRDDAVVAISSDTVDLMGLRALADAQPHRVIEAGIAEQNAMGIASGLATTGMRPYLSGYAPFITARSMEQLRNDVAYANQRVVIGASCSGMTLGVSGGTHHALEDIALMRCMPNMTVLVPADANQAWHLTQAASALDGPSYIRLGGRAEETPITAVDAAPTIGKADQLREGNDVTIIACGVLVALAMDAANALAKEGIEARVLNMHTIKPLDRDAVLSAAAQTKGIVCAEEHRVTGGLGDAVAQLLVTNHPSPMRFVGMPDEFAIVGPTDQVRERYGMSAENIQIQCRALLSR